MLNTFLSSSVNMYNYFCHAADLSSMYHLYPIDKFPFSLSFRPQFMRIYVCNFHLFFHCFFRTRLMSVMYKISK